MKREKFVKYRFQAYQRIDFKHSQIVEPVECMLVSIDFDNEIMVLRPFPTDNPFTKEEFPVHISMCELSRPKLKIA